MPARGTRARLEHRRGPGVPSSGCVERWEFDGIQRSFTIAPLLVPPVVPILPDILSGQATFSHESAFSWRGVAAFLGLLSLQCSVGDVWVFAEQKGALQGLSIRSIGRRGRELPLPGAARPGRLRSTPGRADSDRRTQLTPRVRVERRGA